MLNWVRGPAAAAAVLGLVAPLEAQVRLNGAGATFPNIIYQNWVLTYNQQFDQVELNYQSIGSGGGWKAAPSSTTSRSGLRQESGPSARPAR